jgi:hypothetical protein
MTKGHAPMSFSCQRAVGSEEVGDGPRFEDRAPILDKAGMAVGKRVIRPPDFEFFALPWRSRMI